LSKTGCKDTAFTFYSANLFSKIFFAVAFASLGELRLKERSVVERGCKSSGSSDTCKHCHTISTSKRDIILIYSAFNFNTILA
jgi:hypothetical protein